MVDLEEKQKYWREQLLKFEAKYWLPGHFSFLNFDMEQGNYVVKEGLDSIYEDDAIEIYHRVNTGWAMWKKCTSSMKAEINDLKAKLEKTCKWSPDENLNWWTQCGNGFVFGDDPHPTSHNFKHCCYCGGVIEAAQGEGNV